MLQPVAHECTSARRMGTATTAETKSRLCESSEMIGSAAFHLSESDRLRRSRAQGRDSSPFIPWFPAGKKAGDSHRGCSYLGISLKAINRELEAAPFNKTGSLDFRHNRISSMKCGTCIEIGGHNIYVETLRQLNSPQELNTLTMR